jgi:hypothetical protein
MITYFIVIITTLLTQFVLTLVCNHLISASKSYLHGALTTQKKPSATFDVINNMDYTFPSLFHQLQIELQMILFSLISVQLSILKLICKTHE